MATPFKMKGSPMARNYGAPFRDETKAVKSTILPTVVVSAEKDKLKNTITMDGDEQVYTKSKGSKSTEYTKNPNYKKGAAGNNYKWVRRDGASDQYGPVGFN